MGESEYGLNADINELLGEGNNGDFKAIIIGNASVFAWSRGTASREVQGLLCVYIELYILPGSIQPFLDLDKSHTLCFAQEEQGKKQAGSKREC